MIPILLLALAFEAPQRCSISGTVVDSVTGAGLPKVQVELMPLDRLTHSSATTVTDAEGRFTMVDVDPGAYRLSGQRSRYLDLRKVMLRLEAGQRLERVTHKLVPAGVIAGTVRDADGEPVEGAHVVVAARKGVRFEGGESTETDDQGNYRFGHLRPGSYLLAVEPSSRGWDKVDHSPAGRGMPAMSIATYYPGAPDPMRASLLSLRPGGKMEGVNVTLLKSPVFRLKGRVLNAGGPVALSLFSPVETIQDFSPTTIARGERGEFEFRGVAPGTYLLTTDGSATPVTVSAGDVEGIEVSLDSGASVRGHVVVDGEPGRKLAGRVHLVAGVRGRYPPTIGPDGSFAIRHVPAGNYRVEVRLQEAPDLYVKSIRWGDLDVQANGLTLLASGAATLEVVMARGGEVGGTVGNVKGATVVAVGPETRSVTADPFGTFTVAGLPPGEYRVYAWEDVEDGAWEDAEWLKQFDGTAVTVGERERKTVVVKAL